MRGLTVLRRLTQPLRWLIVALCVCWLGLRLVPVPRLLDPATGSRALYDKGGGLLTLSLSADEKYRLYTPAGEISSAFKQATMLYEDRRFFLHPGVNPIALVRSAVQTALHPDRPVGGSTLTMQLARLRFGLKTRSVFGKLEQMFWALVLERHYSKEEILEAYLNLAPYGANIEGIGAASLAYFHKPARDLTVNESMSLAVLPQHPSRRWRKSGEADLEQARQRLAGMWREATGSEAVPRDLLFSAADVPNSAPHLFSRLRKLHPDAAELRSTLDPELQRDAENVLASNLARFADLGVHNGSVLLAELPNLDVRAYVGSADYLSTDINGFVNGLNAPRSPGSLLKPFIYALALDQGKIIPETMLLDVPLRLASYKPENFERNFLGPISAANALVRSRNIPALELFRSLEEHAFYKFLGDAGVGRLAVEDHYGIALVLGGLGVSAEEAAQLYGVIGNRGEMGKLRFFTDEKIVAAKSKLLSPEASFLVEEMLSRNPPALGRFRSRRIPWKTGTSYASKDAWAAGIVGDYVMVVWLGNFDGTPNPNLVGRDFAGPVFFSMVDRMLSRGEIISPPSQGDLKLKKVEVCALSGALPSSDCPHRKESWFIPGKSPIKTCEVHKRIELNPATGLRSCAGPRGDSKVFEVWSSDMQELFLRAGLKRGLPPAYDEECSMPSNTSQGLRIISPEEHLDYFIESHRDLELEFLVSAPGDAKSVAWFVNDQPVAQVVPTKAVYWKAKAGDFEVRAVDDLGRASKVTIKVAPKV